MALKEVSVFAPATVANVGCGFDVLGFAVSHPGDMVVVRRVADKGICISDIRGDRERLPREVEKNTAGIAIAELMNKIETEDGLEIEIHKKMPLGSGLGSSAASAVAGVVAANILFEEPLSQTELLQCALKAEESITSNGHADNIAASLYGGFVLVRSYDPLDIVQLPTPVHLHCTILHPHIEIHTGEARRLLPKKILLEDATAQWGNLAGFISGLYQDDYDLIGKSIEDRIAEPVRTPLIPGFSAIKQAAMDSGALGSSISGSGPSIFALSDDPLTAGEIGRAMQRAARDADLDSTVYVSKVNEDGPRVIKRH